MELLRLDRLTFVDLLSPLFSVTNHVDSWLAPELVAARFAPRVTINFKQAYNEFGPWVRRIGLGRAKIAPGDADDFVHEVFKRVWENRERFRGESTAKAWVIGIAFNVARNFAKRYKPPIDAHLDCDSIPAGARPTPEERAMRGEAEAQVALAVSRLTEYEQSVFMYYFADLSVTEAAQLCNVRYEQAREERLAVRKKVERILAQLQRENGWRRR